MSVRRVSGALVGAIAAILAVAGVSWACTSLPLVRAQGGPTAAAGSEVRLEGESLPAEAPVVILWNDLAGAEIASAVTDAKGSFATSATLPEVAPGIYTIVVAAKNTAVARMAFQVTASPVGGKTSLALAGSEARPWASEPSSATGSSSPAPMVGAGLLGAGLVALFSGFTVAALRRRRVPAIRSAGSE